MTWSRVSRYREFVNTLKQNELCDNEYCRRQANVVETRSGGERRQKDRGKQAEAEIC